MKSILTPLILLIPFLTFGQDWMDLMNSPNPNFYEIQDAYNAYWDGHEPEKGKGIKQYKRWEWFMESRVDEDGNLPSARHIFKELAKVKMQRALKSGGAWQPIGPIETPFGTVGYQIDGIGRITNLIFHPTDTLTMYACAPAGGLWKTTNGGESWTTNTDYLPNLGVSDLLIHPHNDSILYMSSGDGSVGNTASYGVLKSTDGGISWDSTGLSFGITQNRNIHDMVMDTANPERIFAATTAGIFRSLDAGETWNLEASGNVEDIQFKYGSSDTIFASTNSGSGGRIYRSTDGGDTWPILSNGFPTTGPRRVKIALTPADPNRIYAVCTDNGNNLFGVFRSDNAGETWQLMTDSPNMLGYSTVGTEEGGPAWYALDIAVSNTNPNTVVIGSANMWKSTDGGANFFLETHWTGVEASYVHADHYCFSYQPGTNTLYVTSDGGVARKATTWSGFDVISDGISATQFYRLSVSNNDPDLVTGGAQDNGSMRWKNGNWQIIGGGDGMETIISHDDDSEIYHTTQNGSFYRSIDGGNTFSNNLAPSEGPWVTAYVQDPYESNILYCGMGNIYRSENNAGSWFSISPTLTNSGSSNIKTVEVFYSNTDIIFANTSDKLWRTTDLDSWEVISNGIPSNGMSSFAVNPFDENEIWATYSGYTENRQVYRTLDGGQNWDNMSLNLPALPVNCVTIEKSSIGGVYIGTDVGIYYIDKTISLWEPFMTDLPNVIVNEMEIMDDVSEITTATYGRGMWRSATRNVINVGIEESRTSEQEISIYPNPTNGTFSIELPSNVTNVVLLDAYGKKLRKFEPNSNFVVATSTNLKSGIYYVQATTKTGTILNRLVITK